jgi:hypothetical protein
MAYDRHQFLHVRAAQMKLRKMETYLGLTDGEIFQRDKN